MGRSTETIAKSSSHNRGNHRGMKLLVSYQQTHSIQVRSQLVRSQLVELNQLETSTKIAIKLVFI